MRIKPVVAAAMLIGVVAGRSGSAQVASSEQEFRQMAAALKANDAERRSVIATCIKRGIGDNPAGATQFMIVPMEKAAEAWCTRMTSGIATGLLTLAAVSALNGGTVTLDAPKVLTTISEGK